MRILLVYPPVLRTVGLYCTPLPLGLLQVGRFLRDQGHDVRALNLELGGDIRTASIQRMRRAYSQADALGQVNDPKSSFRVEFRRLAEEFRPEVVGFSCATEQITAARRLSEDARSLLPDVRIEYGDIGRRSSSWVRDVSRAAAQSDPALDLLVGQNPSESFGAVLTSLGCAGRCTFCASPGICKGHVTPLPIEAIERRVRQALSLGANQLDLLDESLTANAARAIQIADLLGRLGLPWRGRAQAGAIIRQPQLVDYFRRCGCLQLTFPAPSGSPRVLEMMKVVDSPEQFTAAGEILHRAGMPFAVESIVGYPGETDDDVGQTVELLERVGPRRVLAGGAVPYHGTELHDSRPDVAAEAGKWPFCRWSPFDPDFLCDRRGKRFAGPAAATTAAFFEAVESINSLHVGRQIPAIGGAGAQPAENPAG